MNSQTQAAADKWVEELAASLQLYAEEKRMQSIALLAQEARVQKRMFYEIYNGRTLAKDTELYAQIFNNLKLAEADPRRLPVSYTVNTRTGLRTLKPLAWSEKRWQSWVDSKNPVTPPPIDSIGLNSGKVALPVESDVTQLSEADFLSHRQHEKQYAVRLGVKLQQWMDAHGISTVASFAQSLGVTRKWLSRIMNDKIIGLDTEKYALIYKTTQLEEAAPWELPDDIRKLPKGGLFTIRRAWSKEEYLKWEHQQDGDSFNELPTPILPEIPVPVALPIQPEAPVCEPPTVEVQSLPIETPPDQMVHLSLAALAETLKSSFLELAHRGGLPPTEPVPEKSIEPPLDRIALLVQSNERIESKLDRLFGVSRDSSSTAIVADLESTSTQALMQELKKRLTSSKSTSAATRDQLSQSIGRLAGELFPYLDAYAQATPEKREEVLKSMKEFR